MPDLLYALLLPYLGPEVASAAQKKAKKRTTRKPVTADATA